MAESATIELRIGVDEKELLQKAAEQLGQSMNSFVLETVMPAAHRIVERTEGIYLSETAWEDFWRMVDSDTPVPELARTEAADFMRRLNLKPVYPVK